jgi:23S rRNA pseudouridine1911/1915/1917 synthase
MDSLPYILEETDDFAVVFKPPKMHCAPLPKRNGGTLLEWYAGLGQVKVPLLMHRLDFETHGLVLFAKNRKSFDFFKSIQEKDEFIKEYSAVCCSKLSLSSVPNSSFPPLPVLSTCEPSSENPLVIESYFRPYGPGRKLVRPVIDGGKKHREIAKDRGGFYLTEITGREGNVFTVRIKRGFRHQIRCHLCWIGFPIQNDPLYSEQETGNSEGILALRAHALFFADPSTGRQREYRIKTMLEKAHV